MPRTSQEIIDEIDVFHPIGGDWQSLDTLLAELWSTGEPHKHIAGLLAVLERFPGGDGAGVLWSIVHGLESLPGYESALIRSACRKPSELSVAMIGRLLNGGTTQIGEISLVELLREIALRDAVPECVRRSAASWVVANT